MAWRAALLDGKQTVDAYEVTGVKHLPAGVNGSVIDGTRTLLDTLAGPVELQVGDWIVRCGWNDCIRLPYDQAAARLT